MGFNLETSAEGQKMRIPLGCVDFEGSTAASRFNRHTMPQEHPTHNRERYKGEEQTKHRTGRRAFHKRA